MSTRNRNIGSISSGTMRAEDLIPEFLAVLESQKPLRHAHKALAKSITAAMESDGYFDSEESHDDLGALFTALDEYAPEYFYFGGHPGNGADYGFWLSEDFLEEFDGLKVSDLADVPRGHSGEVVVVNDHGNMSLYSYSRGKSKEIWSVV